MMSIVQQLGKAARGRVAGPGDADLLNCIRIDNGRTNRRPAAALLPAGADDVASAIRFARGEGLKLTARSGGHGASGYCLNEGGIVLGMRSLSTCRSTPRPIC